MFDENLLDSSPSRAPVLTGTHWAICFAAGALGFLVVFFGLPIVFVPPEINVLIFQSVVLGTFLYTQALFLCYIYADSRRSGLSGTWVWMVLSFFLWVLGFLFYLVYSAAKTDNWKRATIPIAYIIECILVGVTILVPLIYTEALPKAQLMTFLVAPPPPPPPPPPPMAAAPVRAVRRVTAEDIMRAPTVIPRSIKKVIDEPEPVQSAAVGVVGGVPGGMPGGSPGGVLGSIISSVAVPPPPPPKATTPKRIRVGGQVEAAKLIFRPTPEYPPLAKMARIQGTVRLEAIISRDGTIQDLKVVSGHPLLVKSALEAVQRWRYQPTLLNGEPVEVVTEVDVTFTLAE
jgi:protein TonB